MESSEIGPLAKQCNGKRMLLAYAYFFSKQEEKCKTILCGDEKPVRTFELTLSPIDTKDPRRD